MDGGWYDHDYDQDEGDITVYCEYFKKMCVDKNEHVHKNRGIFLKYVRNPQTRNWAIFLLLGAVQLFD